MQTTFVLHHLRFGQFFFLLFPGNSRLRTNPPPSSLLRPVTTIDVPAFAFSHARQILKYAHTGWV